MDRESFWNLYDLIRHDPIFISDGRRPQRSPLIQLATFLGYVGGESGIKTALGMSIAEGTVWLYITRVSHALRQLRDTFIRWPDYQQRDVISDIYELHGFPGCLGACDGSYFRAAMRPQKNGLAYYCRKGFYAVCSPLLTAICCNLNLPHSISFRRPVIIMG